LPLNPGEVLNKRYRIVVLLGQGGFGAVYRAWDLNLERPCAVKENLETAVEAQKQFKREAKILAELSHPNLPHVYDHFIIPGQGQYLVMDFVDGQDLQEMLENKGNQPLPEDQVLSYVGQVCDALIYLHSQSPPVIHRDIKPANIRITPDGKAVLVDFGISKIYDPILSTTTGARAVTHGYAAPEQYGAGKTDPQTDVYSIGATAYALFTGQTPPASIDIINGNSPPPISVHLQNPIVSAELSAVVESAMQLDKTVRTRNAAEFKSALYAKHLRVTKTVVINGGSGTWNWARWIIGAALIITILLLGVVFRDEIIELFNGSNPPTTTAEQPVSKSTIPPATVTSNPTTPEPTEMLTRTPEDTPTTPFSTSTPVWVNYLSVRKPTINDIKDMKSIWETNVVDIGDIASPGIRFYEGLAEINKEFLWPYFWCTQGKDLLEQNLDNMEVKFYIDDQLLSDNYVFSYDYDNNTGWNCSYWATVFMGLRKNLEVKFDIKYTIREPIHDGQNYFSHGDYTHQLKVIFE
jgi:serine/threonine-protein kinase